MLKSLTSLRFFAMLIIFLSHLNFMCNVPSYENIYNNYFSYGSAGVTFFLVLSGFTISYNYLEKFKNANREYSTAFIIKRIARIYPLHIITLIISIPYCISCFEKPISGLIKLILNVFLLQDLIPSKGSYLSFNSVSWTLSCLAIFYAITPILLTGINKLIKKYREKGAYAFILIIYLFGCLLVELFYKEDSQMCTWLFYVSPFFRIIDYSIGLMLGSIFILSKDKKNVLGIWEYLCLFGYGITLILNKHVGMGFRLGLYWLPMSALIILFFAFEKGTISKFISKPFFLELGNISFSFYLFHYPIIRYTVKFVEEFTKIQWNSTNVLILIIFTFLSSIIVSVASYRYIENPLRIKITNMLNSKG